MPHHTYRALHSSTPFAPVLLDAPYAAKTSPWNRPRNWVGNCHLENTSSNNCRCQLPTMYFPMTGRSLNPLEDNSIRPLALSFGLTYILSASSSGNEKFLCSGWYSKMKSLVGVSLCQHIPTFSKPLGASCGKMSTIPAVRRLSPSGRV